jgi:hypothetical protein
MRGRKIKEVGVLSRGMYIRNITDIPKLYELSIARRIMND